MRGDMKNKTIDLKTGVILVRLTRGKSTLIDKKDLQLITGHNWRTQSCGGRWYAAGSVGKEVVLLHRFITNAPSDMEVDHIDGNGLNNTRANIRICTHAQNMANRKLSKNSRTGFNGVSVFGKRYRAFIEVRGEKIYLGSFGNKIFAAKAYNRAAYKYFGQYATLNDVD